MTPMQMKLELVAVPVSDVDRAKAFYTQKIGFHADFDQQVREDLRFVQLTPPGSACSIVIGVGITTMQPGSLEGLLMVVPDVKAVREALRDEGFRTGWEEGQAMAMEQAVAYALDGLPSTRGTAQGMEPRNTV